MKIMTIKQLTERIDVMVHKQVGKIKKAQADITKLDEAMDRKYNEIALILLESAAFKDRITELYPDLYIEMNKIVAQEERRRNAKESNGSSI